MINELSLRHLLSVSIALRRVSSMCSDTTEQEVLAKNEFTKTKHSGVYAFIIVFGCARQRLRAHVCVCAGGVRSAKHHIDT